MPSRCIGPWQEHPPSASIFDESFARGRIQAHEDTATLDRWIDNVLGAKSAAVSYGSQTPSDGRLCFSWM